MVLYVHYLHKKFSTALCLLLPKLLMCMKKSRPTAVNDGKCGFGRSQSTLFTLFVPTVFKGFYLASKVSCVVGCCVFSSILSVLYFCHRQCFACLLLFDYPCFVSNLYLSNTLFGRLHSLASSHCDSAAVLLIGHCLVVVFACFVATIVMVPLLTQNFVDRLLTT